MCERLPNNDILNPDKVEDIVKTAINYADEAPERAYHVKSNWIIIYGISLLICGISTFLNYTMEKPWNVIPGYRTLYVSGREILGTEITDLETGVSDGTKYRRKRYQPRTIVVGYQLIAEDNSAFRSAYNKLNALLDEEQATLIFADEPDKYYIGTKQGTGEVPAGKNSICHFCGGIAALRNREGRREQQTLIEQNRVRVLLAGLQALIPHGKGGEEPEKGGDQHGCAPENRRDRTPDLCTVGDLQRCQPRPGGAGAAGSAAPGVSA